MNSWSLGGNKFAKLQIEKLKIFIKYMVSLRCKMVVRTELERLGLHYSRIDLGEVNLLKNITETQFNQLKYNLLKSGLELMDDQKSILIERIKNTTIKLVHYSDGLTGVNFTEYLSQTLEHDYAYLSSLFSDVMGMTIEHFIISNKIERVKELLIYDQLSLTEISYKLNYSSVSHLSNQFKKVTGLNPTFFKSLKIKRLNKAQEK